MSETILSGPSGFRHIALEEVDSTNAYALAKARTGDPGGLWVTSRVQLAGKGRRGRQWLSEAGNLYASLLLVDPAAQAGIGTLPLVAALGVYRALKDLFARNPHALAIKWPNDLLVDGSKIAGILLEGETLPNGKLAVVIGCGINCAHHPSGTLYPTTDLAECGFEISPEQTFLRLTREMAATLSQWDQARGFADIRKDWLLAASGIGDLVTVRGAEGETGGIFEDIDRDGYLLLNVGGERRRISAGDLFFSARTGA